MGHEQELIFQSYQILTLLDAKTTVIQPFLLQGQLIIQTFAGGAFAGRSFVGTVLVILPALVLIAHLEVVLQ